MAHVIDREVWAEGDRWHGEMQGVPYGRRHFHCIFNDFDRIGGGPRLHKHPYPETFIIRSGRALFTVGESEIEASAGQILVVPADTPHKFRNLGPEALVTIDVHASEKFITEWLE
jgi:mannose-6-phosphate isomerase-like protein (cupin superfamily)